MNPLEAYLRELDRVRASGAGTPELSYYNALATLFSTAGEKLDLEVRCIMPLADQGAGFPDGGLFTQDQLQQTNGVPLPGQRPARGVIEVKPAGVWDYTLGGYPVIKKWLSYREERVLGRHLRPEEARAVTDIARRITAMLMMGPALDEVYAAVKRAGFEWPPRIE